VPMKSNNSFLYLQGNLEYFAEATVAEQSFHQFWNFYSLRHYCPAHFIG